MSAPADLNAEFEFFDSSDDGSPLPALNFETALDSLQPFEAGASADAKGASLSALRPVGGELSPKSSQGSTAESSSSKRTHGSASTKTSFSGGDVVMTDGLEVKSEWKPEDFIHDDEDQTFTLFDGTVDPSSIENPFGFSDGQMPTDFEFNSASSSPGPFAETASGADSPNFPRFTTDNAVLSRPSEQLTLRGHNMAYPRHSLTQSMNGLKTTSSREVSPTTNTALSHETSPSAFYQSPSPPAAWESNGLRTMDYAHTGDVWPSSALGTNTRHDVAAMQPFNPAGTMPMASNMPVYPYPAQFFAPGPCHLTIQPTPLKSRVETQIPIKMSLSALPPGIRRLHLPTYTISKPKLLAKPRPERCADMLELHTTLVCTSAMQNSEQREGALERARNAAQAQTRNLELKPDLDDEPAKPQDGGYVQICSGCVTRERKRAARKKIKKVEDEELWKRDEDKRVVVFNTAEVKDWQPSHPNAMDSNRIRTEVHIDVPMRIACYCRHHQEKLGFQVIFTMTDFQGNYVAQAMSTSIMITDDHKTHTLPAENAASSASKSEPSLTAPLANAEQDGRSSLSPEAPVRLSYSSSDLSALGQMQSPVQARTTSSINSSKANSAIPTPRNLSRPASPTSMSGPYAKKRKASSSAKVPSGLAMTRLETARPPVAQPHNSQMGPVSSASVSPFSPNLQMFPTGQDPMFGLGPGTPGTMIPPYPAGPPTPNSNDPNPFGRTDRSGSLENLATTQLYSAPASSHPSRAPSPNSLRNSAAALQQANFVQALTNSLYTLPVGMNSAVAPAAPLIHKIIPNEGPKCGGIEVTVLGGGFYQGLEVMFGDIKATTTTYWGDSSLVCLLPPSPTAGNVLVSFKQHPPSPRQPFLAKPQQPVFKYLDDDEQQLMRTALTVLAHKMNGNFEDVADVARRIIGESNTGWGADSSSSGHQRGGGAGAGFNFAYALNLETQLLKVLDLLDVDDSTRKARYNLRRTATGQTMLHLACSLGMHRFVAGLLARGAYCDLRDHGGYTALHLAALNNHPEIVRRLIYAGADPTLRTLSGLTAADVARSREVIRAIRRMERHVRSRSGGSLHSRVNSANSLRSLWEPMSMTQPSDGTTTDNVTTTDEESPEYSSENPASDGDDVDDDVDDGPWITPRRRSTRNSSFVDGAGLVEDDDNGMPSSLLPTADSNIPAGQASPTAAMSAFREQFATQFQQFQQAMALHLQNLSQLPYIPQMPNFSGMPPLPDYQAYLNSAPVIQRITALVPNIGGSRPGSAGESPPAPKEMDGRWWDLSSLMQSSAPPPAYEELFPQGELDKKQASAAQAAADAEADAKCATLYDQTATASTEMLLQSQEEPEQQQPQPQLPHLLQIGRKNAITKEQQDNLRRAHAERLKRLSRDRNLFFIWIPLLIIIICAMLYNRFPALVATVSAVLEPLAQSVRAVNVPAQDRVVEVE